MKKNEFGVKAIGVDDIPTNSLKANPHNPRRLFDQEDMEVLRESIKRVGILVPLVVYKESTSGNYVILDGQRRWMCAQQVGLKRVPVNLVREPTLVQNIVTMFQIHKLRKDWELMPTALKLELLMTQLNEKNERRLAELTGLDVAVVTRCRKLLSYNRRFQDMMLEPNPDNRVKADFFIELYPVRTDRLVVKLPWFKKDKFTDQMLEKWRSRGIKSVTDFRIVKQYITNAVKAGNTRAISDRLKEFAESPELAPDHLNINSAKVAAEAKKLSATVAKLYTHINSIKVEDFYGQDEMWNHLDNLSKLIREKLRELGRRAGE